MTDLRAVPGVGQVTLHWDRVDDAVGYQVLRAHDDAADPAPLQTASGVATVPHGPFTDTSAAPGVTHRYAVRPLDAAGTPGPASAEVRAAALPHPGTRPRVEVGVDAIGVLRDLPRPWQPTIDAGRIDPAGGLGDDLAAALRAAHDELGVRSVRAHGLLDGAYREVDGRPVHDFAGIDRALDAVRELGLYPVVGLSFMPRDLAADPTKTLPDGGVVSPPKDDARWADLVRALAQHLVDRYGLPEVREEWAFEVWTGPDALWAGTAEEFRRLYDVSAAALREVDTGLRVGGPTAAALDVLDEFLHHTSRSGSPLDAVTVRADGRPPLDLRPLLARHGHDDTPLWCTGWGVVRSTGERGGERGGPDDEGGARDAHGHDDVAAAALVLRAMRSAAGRVDALAAGLASDACDPAGPPQRLTHAGPGLRTVGGLRKPQWWAVHLLERLGESELACRVTGDGAGHLVDCWASTDEEVEGVPGEITVLLWNGCEQGARSDLDRDAVVHVDRLPVGTYQVHERRVDATHSNVCARWAAMAGGAAWPTEEQWAQLRAADRLDDGAPARRVATERGRITVEVDLPSPSLVLLEIVPAGAAAS